jgi:hypothetical protein
VICQLFVDNVLYDSCLTHSLQEFLKSQSPHLQRSSPSSSLSSSPHSYQTQSQQFAQLPLPPAPTNSPSQMTSRQQQQSTGYFGEQSFLHKPLATAQSPFVTSFPSTSSGFSPSLSSFGYSFEAPQSASSSSTFSLFPASSGFGSSLRMSDCCFSDVESSSSSGKSFFY